MKTIVIIAVISLSMFVANAQDRCNDPIISPDTITERLRIFDSLIKHYIPDRTRIDTLKSATSNKEVHILHSDINTIDKDFFSTEICESVEIDNSPFIQNKESQCLLTKLKKLRSLRILNIRPLSISDCMGELSSIDSLTILHNKIDTIPDCIFENKNLKYLFWQSNCTKYFGDCANTEVNITSLTFMNEVLYDIPFFLLKAKKLKELYFTFDIDADYSKWNQVLINNKELILLAYGYSKLKEIPNEIFDLKLEYLGIHHGCLESVSSKIRELNKLKILDLSNNRIVKLPEEIGELRDSLEELYLDGNQIPIEEQERIKKWLPKTKVVFE